MKSSSFSLMGIILLSTISCIQETRDERFLRETKEYTKRHCPQQIDSFVILDSVVYYKPNNKECGRYAYYHTVTGDSFEIYSLKQQEINIKNTLLSKINNSQDLKYIKDSGVIIQYTFYSRHTNELLFDFRYTKEMYK